MSITVVNLSTGDERTYTGISASEAVIAAYAQSRGDWSTWQYAEKYANMVTKGKVSVACGDWCTMAT